MYWVALGTVCVENMSSGKKSEDVVIEGSLQGKNGRWWASRVMSKILA